jgi:hypothetical protein
MQRLLFVTLALAASATPASAQTATSKLARAKGWHLSYEAGRDEARRTGKPLLVVFRCEP